VRELLKKALKVSDQAEVFCHNYRTNFVSFKNATLHDIESSMQSGISLRLIKDSNLGFAYTRNLVDPDEMVENAEASLAGRVDAAYDFPMADEVANLNLPKRDDFLVTNSDLVDEGSRICDLFKSQTDADITTQLIAASQRVQLINSRGTDISEGGTIFATFVLLGYPGTGSRMLRIFTSTDLSPVPDETIKGLAALYNSAAKEVSLKGGQMKVLFMPNSLIAFNWRLASGLSGMSAYEGISPIASRIGEKVLSDKITIYDDPLDSCRPFSRLFDDEGVINRKLTLIDRGEVRNIFTDLKYAHKLGVKSTGHGYRATLWESEPSKMVPTPKLAHLRISSGDTDFAGLLELMDTGIIVEGALGFHSGNIPNGDYSIGANPCFYVRNGEIVGRVKDVMVSGNVYETLQNVIAVGNRAETIWGGSLWHSAVVPPLLCDKVNVTTKGSIV